MCSCMQSKAGLQLRPEQNTHTYLNNLILIYYIYLQLAGGKYIIMKKINVYTHRKTYKENTVTHRDTIISVAAVF